MTLFPELPPPPAEAARPELQQTAAVGPWSGPSYAYRGARIECCRGGHVCGLALDGHPLHGQTFGAVGTITPLVDLWEEGRRLPAYMRVPGTAR
jgi:hypothetical protein